MFVDAVFEGRGKLPQYSFSTPLLTGNGFHVQVDRAVTPCFSIGPNKSGNALTRLELMLTSQKYRSLQR